MSEPFIGQINMFAGNFAPRGWAMCDGQLLPINQNTALFSILGTTYGGNGVTTFALPDLRGRVPMHPGQGPGLSPRFLGEVGGTEVESLTIAQMPAHDHPAIPNNRPADEVNPVANVPGRSPDGTKIYRRSPDAAGGAMDPSFIGPTGGGQPHGNVQPFQSVTFIIALEGIFPSRN